MKKRTIGEAFNVRGQKHYRGDGHSEEDDSSQYAYTKRKLFFDFAYGGRRINLSQN